MQDDRAFPVIRVTRKQEKNIREGSLWVYADEITEQEEVVNGSIVDVRSEKGRYLGSGIWSAASKIRVRILSDNPNETFSDAFWQRRINYAVDYRKRVMGADFGACRIVHGEADGLPGVTADRYNDVLVTEIQSYGMEMRRDILYRALIERFRKEGTEVKIYERNEGALRLKEGLPQVQGWYTEPGEEHVIIEECGIRYDVDIVNGQKTGFFLDQKYNRLTVRGLSRDLKVLDCCTHTGAFALNALYGGAKEVRAMDISASALESARRNAELNGMADRLELVQADVFDYLDQIRESHENFDLIILDPPAFTKNRKSVHNAYHGYLEINTKAMRILKRGGWLVSCSCSHFMREDMFRRMLEEAARSAGVGACIVHAAHASPDHPQRLASDEGEYLKFYVLHIV